MCAWCVHVEVKGQRLSHFSPSSLCGVQESNSGSWAMWQVPFSTESSCWPKRISWIQDFKASLDDSIVRAYLKQKKQKGGDHTLYKSIKYNCFPNSKGIFFLDVLLKGHEMCYSYCLLCPYLSLSSFMLYSDKWLYCSESGLVCLKPKYLQCWKHNRISKDIRYYQAWWHMPAVPATWEVEAKDQELMAILCYINSSKPA